VFDFRIVYRNDKLISLGMRKNLTSGSKTIQEEDFKISDAS